MTDEAKRMSLSRRDVIRISGGTALAAAALGSLEIPSGGSTPPGGSAAIGAGSASASGAAGIRLAGGSADLLIRDGTPHWWQSPDIWVVPGSDPTGAPGTPTAGGIAYVWARVHNTGDEDAVGAQVVFYWGNPSTQMRYSTLNHIGTSFVDVPAGGVQDVLCLAPWHVVTVNGGHECLVVTVAWPGDPPLPDIVDPPGYPNVAQRNLTVAAAEELRSALALTVEAPPRQDKKILVYSKIGATLTKDELVTLGLVKSRPVTEPVVTVGLSLKPPGDSGTGKPELEVTVPAGRSVPVYLTIRDGEKLGTGQYQLVQIVERDDKQVLGGISFAVVGKREAA